VEEGGRNGGAVIPMSNRPSNARQRQAKEGEKKRKKKESSGKKEKEAKRGGGCYRFGGRNVSSGQGREEKSHHFAKGQ